MAEEIFDVTRIYQKRTTIPQKVRELLNIKDGDSVVWKFQNGLVSISKSKKTKDVFKYGLPRSSSS